MLGLTAVFGNLTLLPGFTTDEYMTFILPVGFLQGAGIHRRRDRRQPRARHRAGLVRPAAGLAARRAGVLLAGTVLSASLRALMPITLLMIVGLALGVDLPGRRRPR